MTHRHLAALVTVGLVLLAPCASGQPTADPAPDEPWLAVYQAFQREFEADRFEESLPLAKELVELLEEQVPPSDQLPTAYNNLGVVQWRLGDLTAAEASFTRSLELLEQTQGIASRRLVAPLGGLATVYAEQGQHARAADALQRAIAVNRRAEGLFNLQQLDLLEQLVRSYEALGAVEGVDRELRYMLQVVQKRYGEDDPRTLPTLARLAGWYEQTERYAVARGLWSRVGDIASREGGGRNAATINALLGIARSYRLQFVLKPESLTEHVPLDPITGRPDPLAAIGARGYTSKLDPDGEAAALQALQILETTPDPPKPLLAMTLMELGDWYVTARDPVQATTYYERAWPVVGEVTVPGEANPLSIPRPVYYRLPPAGSRDRLSPDLRVVSRKIEFGLDVADSGEITGVTLISTEAGESETSQVRRALERAWFSPRFEDGRAVATSSFLFTDYWYDVAEPEAEPAPDDGSGSEATGKKPEA